MIELIETNASSTGSKHGDRVDDPNILYIPWLHPAVLGRDLVDRAAQEGLQEVESDQGTKTPTRLPFRDRTADLRPLYNRLVYAKAA